MALARDPVRKPRPSGLALRYPTIEDLRKRARRRVPRFAFDYVDGAAGAGETCMARNAAALDAVPDLSLAYLKKTLPTKEPDGLEPYLDGLRKAGLPE